MGYKRTKTIMRKIDKELDEDILKLGMENGVKTYPEATRRYIKKTKEIRWRLLGLMERKHR